MEHVTRLLKSETVRLDQDQLHGLYQQMGESGAEEVVCRAIEELAVRLSHCERHWRDRDYQALRKCARSLIAIADQIGMNALARVARDVTIAADNGDYPALGATLFRLVRIGETSLVAVWDLQDLSI
ncbi:hypothetical protein [Sedimentitalea arenosa]|uniref:Uncharacterized protein n=1 Tax=Sedimentitalea arenosa TaxID=2798803 RepID=A0A8J7LWP6_9RHOB|nr:hypothetical protein [Arenibacterium arenosum]MBJ6372501.1 hypothetical protein [Arenibacterium arenosum]